MTDRPTVTGHPALPSNRGRVSAGAYGLAVTGDVVDIMAGLLVRPAAGWPQVELRWQPRLAHPPTVGLAGDLATAPLLQGHLVLEREARVARYCQDGPPDSHQLAHPCLAAAAAVFAWWDGRLAFHAGGFVLDGRAWGVLGAREAGKSTMMAWLAEAGHDVVADDLLVLDGDLALAGPRSIDLRPPAAQRLTRPDGLVTVRAGQRSRVLLSQMAPETPFGGFVVLGVGDEVGATRVPPSERLQILGPHLTVRLACPFPAALLELATLPMWRVDRSRDWADMPKLLDCLLATVSG